MTPRTRQFMLVVAALAGPPVVTYLLSSLVPQHGLDIFSVLFIEALAFALIMIAVQPRVSSAILLGVLYFPFMFGVIFWIGYRAGYYDLP